MIWIYGLFKAFQRSLIICLSDSLEFLVFRKLSETSPNRNLLSIFNISSKRQTSLPLQKAVLTYLVGSGIKFAAFGAVIFLAGDIKGYRGGAFGSILGSIPTRFSS